MGRIQSGRGLERLALLGLAFFMAGPLRAADSSVVSCGDNQILCDPVREKCCEHFVATQSGHYYSVNVQGKCIAKSETCSGFGCGATYCDKGLFATPTVCCRQETPGGTSRYSCAARISGCPDSPNQLSIRDKEPRKLQRG